MSIHEPVNILLVDDQPSKLLSYEVILSGLGENLIKTTSARDALEQILRKEIAIVLTDVSMPEFDGFELAAMIREHPRFQRTAIIFVSAIHLTDLDLLRGYEAGAVDYVPVPVIPDLLRAKVKVFADLYRKTRQLELLNAELESRVAQRTAELEEANAALEQRVEERTREREAALAQLHEMQKMESLGQLTGGVAHDFNNLLMAVLGNLSLLKRRLPDDAGITRLIDNAIQGAERGAALTKRMLAFARRQELVPVAVEVSRLIDGMADMLRRTIGPTIAIGIEIEPDLPPILVDPNQLELSLLNLALNARDAMPDGGRMDIKARRERDSLAGAALVPGDYVCLSVADTGIGMDDATLKRAAEPFFTTKGIGKGTGLGLSMVHGLAAQSGGAMRIASTSGEGTTVRLWLPVGSGTAVHHEPPRGRMEELIVRGPSCRVLVVDDDPLIAASATAMLQDLGHIVIEASSAARALDALRLGAQVDIVLTDHAMPGMTGLELAQHMHRHWPGIPVIITSGYADLSGSDGGISSMVLRLPKPYQQADLAACINYAMGFGKVVAVETARRA